MLRDRASDEPGHRAAVDAWIERSIRDGSSDDVLQQFHAAFEAIWNRAVTTLGSVTLTAIAERVLWTATEKYGFLAAINPRPNGDARWIELMHKRLSAVPRPELVEGLRFGLVELLTIIGALTAEILSQDLQAALMAAGTTTSESKPATDSHAHRSSVRR